MSRTASRGGAAAEIQVAAVALLPWLTLVLFHVIVVLARLRDGQWPYYQSASIDSSVDLTRSFPEYWPNLGGLVRILGVLVFVCGPLLPFQVTFVGDRRRARLWSVTFAGGTYVLFAYLTIDPFGFLEWFKD